MIVFRLPVFNCSDFCFCCFCKFNFFLDIFFIICKGIQDSFSIFFGYSLLLLGLLRLLLLIVILILVLFLILVLIFIVLFILLVFFLIVFIPDPVSADPFAAVAAAFLTDPVHSPGYILFPYFQDQS